LRPASQAGIEPLCMYGIVETTVHREGD